jgi:predicted aminopeptidase
MCKLYRCFLPSFGLFGKVVSKENNLRNQPNRKKNCLCWLCLTDRDEMSNLYRGPLKDASHQSSVHLAKQFQRRRFKCEKLTDDGRQRITAKLWQKKAHMVFGQVS